MLNRHTYTSAGALLLAALVSGHSHAGGLPLHGQGIKQLGSGFAGTATRADDPSALANNPAALVKLEGRQLSAGLIHGTSKGDYRADVSRGGDAAAVEGRRSGSHSLDATLPQIFYGQRLSERSAAGLGIYIPHQLETRYEPDWTGRYHAMNTEVQAINLNPVFAFNATDRLAFGLGAIVQYVDTTFSQQYDVGYLLAEGALQGSDPALREQLIGNFDVYSNSEADNISYAFNAGLIWQPASDTRFGFSYRSKVNHVMDSDSRRQIADNYRNDLQALLDSFAVSNAEALVDFTLGPAGVGSGGFESRLTLPEAYNFGLLLELSHSWHFMMDVGYTRWSQVDDYRQHYNVGEVSAPPEGVDINLRGVGQEIDWRDTWHFSFGSIFRLSESLTLRGGFGADQSPVRGPYTRSFRTPSSNRTWIAAGASYQIAPALSLDAAYLHAWASDARLDTPETVSGHTAEGRYNNGQTQLLGLQLNYRF
ncbi:hypothetical protein CAI21_21270 [Alkalilimnicola ehrlichii]|uniref:Membrane protein involved in aromatic hydrocarbon degradation n=1 Tax=Alkalilimnicola ehrlichii TaxID=351052 RepID=A0A3E0WJ86_9GAMM|nr:outer membrane protein transport protein [Alkalilimnicola ehrlichii]RFA24523.1 hypothetical protein CAI21_21270 [Alkalilimnicola ehrlichii]RFA32167.1 hypothetical protein CAL65_20315 [Alkalilimnicola ehrlichii]